MRNRCILVLFGAICTTFVFGGDNDMAVVRASDVHSATEIAQVVNTAFTRAVWRKQDAQRTNEQEIQSMIKHPDKRLYLCLDNKKVCGTALLDVGSGDAVMSLLAVHPEFQGKNIGTILMDHVEKEVISMNKESIFIRVVPVGQEQLVAYYQRHGFIFLNDAEPKPFVHPHIVKEEWQGKLFLHTMRKSLVAKGNMP